MDVVYNELSHQKSENIKVIVRVRPLLETEEQNNDLRTPIVDVQNDTSLIVTNTEGKRSFQCSYDAVLGPQSSQKDVYNIVKSAAESVLDGFNSTVFAYGQTGSGKTYSMYGPPVNTNGSRTATSITESASMGIIPRTIHDIFDLSISKVGIIDFTVHCSFVQIYNENLFDMLRDANMTTPLSIREDRKEIYVQSLSEYTIKNVSEAIQLLKVAEDNRIIRETHMNQFSSRSHSIFQLHVDYKKLALDGGEISIQCKLNLVDLAGSEKWNTKNLMKDEHISEMTNINLSLHTLGKCISALAKNSREREKELKNILLDPSQLSSSSSNVMGGIGLSPLIGSNRNVLRSSQSRSMLNNDESSISSRGGGGGGFDLNSSSTKVHVPYRESKLTRLLQDSLGGNSRTYLLATISPARDSAEESISTLKFADRAKQVMVMATMNEIRPVDHTLVKKLQHEIEMLRELLRKVTEYSHGMIPGPLATPLNHPSIVTEDKQNSPIKLPDHHHHPVQSGGGGSPQKILLSPAIDLEKLSANALGSSHPNHLGPHPHNGKPWKNKFDLDPNSEVYEYMTSLEKALNLEQTSAQHLMKKNETLIKELESMKEMSRSVDSDHFKKDKEMAADEEQRMYEDGPSDPKGYAINPEQLSVALAEVEQYYGIMHHALKQNEWLWSQLDSIQKIMKQFFKFQIEEEPMKEKINTIFNGMKDIPRSHHESNDESIKSSVVIQFLKDFKKMPSAPPFSVTLSQPTRRMLPAIKTNPSHGIKVTKKGSSLTNGDRSMSSSTMDHSVKHLPAIHQESFKSHVHHDKPTGDNSSFERIQIDRKSHQEDQDEVVYNVDPLEESYYQREDREGSNHLHTDHHQYPPHQHQPPHLMDGEVHKHKKQLRKSSSSSSNKHRNKLRMEGNHQAIVASANGVPMEEMSYRLRGVRGNGMVNGSEVDMNQATHGGYLYNPFQSKGVKHESRHDRHDHEELDTPDKVGSDEKVKVKIRHESQHSKGRDSHLESFHDPNIKQLKKQQRQQKQSETSNWILHHYTNELNEHNGGGGQVYHIEDEDDSADELNEDDIHKELNRSKSKLQRQNELEKWTKEKENKLLVDLKAQEEERKAMQEAETLRELKRKERAKKQKQKLIDYQKRIKSEAEKIQELFELGIDPNSLVV